MVSPLPGLTLFSISLPKRHESFIFFQINDDEVLKFRQELSNLILLITTAAEVKRNLQDVVDHKKRHKGQGSQAPIENELLTITGVNIAFSYPGLRKVCPAFLC